MDSSRRRFVQSSAALAAAALLPRLAEGQTEYRLGDLTSGLPILQGATSETSASFVALTPISRDVQVEILGPKGEVLPHIRVDYWPLPGSEVATLEFRVDGITPNIDYDLTIFDDAGQIIDHRIFRALDTRRSDLRVAIVSCMDDAYRSKASSMWQGLSNENCDLVLFLGDTCYADHGVRGNAEKGLARRYAQTRSSLSWFRQQRLTPSLATWDDHDFGANNGDRRFRHAEFTRTLFRKFWGSSENPNYRLAHGVGSVFEGFGQRFYLVDNRSFRDRSRSGSYLGTDQTEWLLNSLNEATEPAWLMGGSQFFGGYIGLESFAGGHPKDFTHFLKQISKVEAPVCFASGDVHFSEVIKIEPKVLGYSTYEITSSSIHSMTAPGHQYRNRNPRRLVSEWRHNYVVLNISTQNGWHIDTDCVLQGNRRSFSRNVQISRG